MTAPAENCGNIGNPAWLAELARLCEVLKRDAERGPRCRGCGADVSDDPFVTVTPDGFALTCDRCWRGRGGDTCLR